MRKILIFASLVVVAGGAYWVYKKEKANKTTTASPATNTANFAPKHQKEQKPQETTTSDYTDQAKSKCVQEVYERHTVAGEVMKDAYSNIMEDFVEDYSIEKTEGVQESNETIIESEDVSVIKELDSIADELDDLLN